MSLIKCPECSKEVSSKAPTCPYCGVVIAGNVKRCPVCGTYTLMEAGQCPQCGTKFIVQTKDAAVSQPDEDTLLSNDAEPQPTEPQQSEASTPPAEKPVGTQGGGAHPTWWLLMLCIVAVCVGGFLYWEKSNQEASEEQAFALLANCTDPLNYEDFIARFPKSDHIGEVRAKLAELERIDKEWEKVLHSQDARELEAFLNANPNSPNKKVALHKIDSLDWRDADKRGTSVAYDAYIMKHDDGEYITQAYSSRDAARRREEQARRDSIAAAEAARDTVDVEE